MLTKFDFKPFVGPLPIEFGMTLDQVAQLLGQPKHSRERENGGYRTLYQVKEGKFVVVFFDSKGKVSEVTFMPGIELWFMGNELMNNRNLIEFLRKFDPAPQTSVGIVLFKELGISMGLEFESTNKDRFAQRTINCFARGIFDNLHGFKPYQPKKKKDE